MNSNLHPPSLDLNHIADNLVRGEQDIWYARNHSHISYPQEGNLNCLALEADSFWFRHRNQCILAAVRRFPPPGILFDVGGGNGYVSLGLQQAGVASALLEPGLLGAQHARQRGVEQVICATLEDAGFQDASLPAVGLFDVLEHISDDAAFLRTVHRLLVPGGRLYLTVPAYRALWSADDDYAGHFRRYTLAHLRGLLQETGFTPEWLTGFFFMLPLPIFLFRALPSRLGWRKGNEWDRYQQEHSSQPGVLGRALERMLSLELAYLSKGHSIPVGGSCLVVAQKAPR